MGNYCPNLIFHEKVEHQFGPFKFNDFGISAIAVTRALRLFSTFIKIFGIHTRNKEKFFILCLMTDV